MIESVAIPIVANTKIARTRGAERMRRCRQRRRDGLRCCRLELRDGEIRLSFAAACYWRAKKPIGTPLSRRCMRFSTTPLDAQRDAQREGACDAQRRGDQSGRYADCAGHKIQRYHKDLR